MAGYREESIITPRSVAAQTIRIRIWVSMSSRIRRRIGGDLPIYKCWPFDMFRSIRFDLAHATTAKMDVRPLHGTPSDSHVIKSRYP